MRKFMTLILSALLAFAFTSSAVAAPKKGKKTYPKAVEMPVDAGYQVAAFKKKVGKKGSMA